MKEKDFQIEFGKRNKIDGVFELKLCKGSSISFSALADHQERSLVDCSIGNGMYHKIADLPRPKKACLKCRHRIHRFQKKKPFDCFLLKNQKAYVVIMFWVPRKKKNVYYIDIRDFIQMRKYANRKSITEAMAYENATIKENYLN